jgi:hypothetical protein
MMGGQRNLGKETTEQKEQTEGETDEVIVEETAKGEDDVKDAENDLRKKTSQGVREIYTMGKITPRIKVSKLT